AASAAKPFHGDADHWNPEEQLIAALAQCHLLSYLHVATQAGIVVESYTDAASGTLSTNPDGSGALVEVVLHPMVSISAGDPATALALHAEANRLCFIANSVNFPVRHEPQIVLLDDDRS
ncbi:MAG: OsmC family protein, partial [Leifsonia sp.]